MSVYNRNKIILLASIIVIPLVLMFILHIGIALGNYCHVSISIEDVSSKDWFMFFGSYLGGVMTLFGVLYTLNYEQKEQQYHLVIDELNNEKTKLAFLINKLDVFLPIKIIQHFTSLPIQKEGYNSNDLAALKKWIIDELDNVFRLKRELLLLTYMCSEDMECSLCEHKCNLVIIKTKFQKIYTEIADEIYMILQDINDYINVESNNVRYKSLIILCKQRNELAEKIGEKQIYVDEIKKYESKIVDTDEQVKIITSKSIEISHYNEKEMWELTNLAISYIDIQKQNALKIISGK